MAGPSKKPKRKEECDSDDDGSESESYNGQQEIEATFEGRNPEGIDFNGIKQLLLQLFPKVNIDISEMCDMLINQQGVGSVLKQSINDSDDEEDVDMVEESDVFGITSVINLSANQKSKCVQQFLEWVDKQCEQHASQEVYNGIKAIINGNSRVGLLINERFINIPAKIAVPMLGSLKTELQRITKKDPSYNFEYLILVSKLYKPKGASGDAEILYSNDEERIFIQSADFVFEFDVGKDIDTGLGGKWSSEDNESIPYRKVLLFKADKFDNILQQITTLTS